ncbi:MAG: hypothetical protein R3F14_35770 [Polyangiaceae bacterium]
MAIAAFAAPGCGGESFEASGGTGGGGGTTASAGSGGTGGGSGGTGGAIGGTGGSTGTTTSSMGGTGGTGGGPACQPLSDACTQCAYGACEDLYCTCYGADDCPALVNCLSVCDPTDNACVKPCLSAHPESISLSFLLGDCVADPCAGECAGAGNLADCPKCLFDKCSTEMNTCLADPECYDIVMCAIACPPNDFACAFGCANGKSQGATNKALAVQGCTSNANLCQAACGG